MLGTFGTVLKTAGRGRRRFGRWEKAVSAALNRRAFSGGVTPDVEVEVVQRHPQGLLVSGTSPATSSKAPPSRGSVFQHEGALFVNVFEVYKYWFASPLSGADTQVKWIGNEQAPDVQNIVRCLKRPTPLQAERGQLTKGLNSGVLAVDVFAPIGIGQSMLISGPQGAGKSTMGKQVLEQVLAGRHVDKALRFSAQPMDVTVDPVLQRAGAFQQLVCTNPPRESFASLLPALFDVLGVAEESRDNGSDALLVLDTVAPLLDAWLLAVDMAEALPDTVPDTEISRPAPQCLCELAGTCGKTAKGWLLDTAGSSGNRGFGCSRSRRGCFDASGRSGRRRSGVHLQIGRL